MGRDEVTFNYGKSFIGFNPHAPMGRDRIHAIDIQIFEHVSIHTPLWGATESTYRWCYPLTVSIHTPLWGATENLKDKVRDKLFQSTRPYGARHKTKEWAGNLGVFQSTRPYGARLRSLIAGVTHLPFQSTRPYGARRKT